MKILPLLMLIYLSIIIPDKGNYTIIGRQVSCRSGRDDSRERYIKLKIKDSILRDNIKTRLGEFKVSGLDKGSYTLEFQNIFGQVCSKNVELVEKKKNIEICTDEFIDTKEVTFFDRLKNDTLYIDYGSSGCFHSEKETLIFYRRNGENYGECKTKTGNVVKTLSPADLTYLILFERKVREIRNGMGGCTTSDTYVFKMKNEKALLIQDDTCDWDGYYEMKKQIFNIK